MVHFLYRRNVVETAIVPDTQGAPTYNDAPNEVAMLAQIQQMLAEMDRLREQMRRDDKFERRLPPAPLSGDVKPGNNGMLLI